MTVEKGKRQQERKKAPKKRKKNVESKVRRR